MCYKNFKAKMKQPDTQRKRENKQNKNKNKKNKRTSHKVKNMVKFIAEHFKKTIIK